MKKSIIFRNTQRSLRAIIASASFALAICSVAPTAAHAEDAECGRSVTAAAFKKVGRPQVREAQAGLFEIYKDDADYKRIYGTSKKPLSDDIIGPVTLFWLKQFCSDFKIEPISNFADEELTVLLHFATIAKAQPDWKKILLSPDFARWIDSQPLPQRVELYKIRRSGSAQQVISVLKLYRDGNQAGHVPSDPKEMPGKLTVYAYQLTDEDFKLLQKKKQILQALDALQDETYANKKQLEAAVTEALKDITDQAARYMPMIQKYAEYSVGFTLTERSLQKLRVNNLPDDILSALQPLQDLEFPGEPEFSAKLKAVAKPSDDQVRQIVQAAERTSSYTLTEAALKSLNADPANATIPGVIVDMLQKLNHVEYPDKELFQKAAQAKIDAGVGACPKNVSQYRREKFLDLSVKEESFKTLKGVIPDDMFNKLDELRGRTSSCSKEELDSAGSLAEKLYALYRTPIDVQATKQPAFDKSKSIQWNGGSCGCVLDQLAGVVYGFYPFWMAGDTQQKVDFSVLSRIGYYGVSFDQNGELRQTNDMSGTQTEFLGGVGDARTDFIRAARKFGTKVDWVIHKSDWQAWAAYGGPQKARMLDKLATNITALLSVKLTDPFSRFKPYLSFGTSEVPTQGDGVTLYFDGYPADGDSVAIFDEFIGKLKARLTAARKGYALNIMLPQSALGPASKGIYEYGHLLKLARLIDPPDENDALDPKERPKKINSNLLILIQEPTTDAKKKLRMEVENALHGVDRKTLLRKIIPVIEFDGNTWQQFDDDIIYFKDNFGGVGLWPRPLNNAVPAAGAAEAAANGAPVTCVDGKSVDNCLVRQYQQGNAEQVSAVCKFVCQNRWGFRLGWDAFALMLLGGVVLYFWGCRCREMIGKYWIPFVVGIVLPTFGLGMALLTCDPYLKTLSNGNWPLILLALCVIAYGIWQYFYRKAKADMP